MKKYMRKHIIKLFALSYIVPFAGKIRSFTRSANIILPLILIGGLIVCAELYSWLYILLPLRWQYEAFQRRVTPEPKSYNAQWVLWVNPLAIAITLTILFTLIL